MIVQVRRTDVAARDLDIPNVTHVTTEVPQTYDDYAPHWPNRSAGKHGTALTFVEGGSY